MKRHCIWAAVALVFAAVFSVGCTSSQSLTPKKIVKEFNMMLEKEGEGQIFADIRVGTYECNSSSERLTLAQLEVAGLIDYTVTRYAWWEETKVSRQKAYQVQETRGWYYTWTETVTKYKWVEETVHSFEDHYIVTVALTNAGKKLIADIPAIEPEDKIKRIEEEQFEAYCDRSFYSEEITLKAGAIKAVKARNILVTEKDGIQTAEAEVIMETCEATDAGRILIGFENGRRDSEDVELIHYLDKGWVIGSLEY